MQRALESALAELTLGAAIAADDAAAVAAWLERNNVQGEDAVALTRDFPRLLVYRGLVRDNLREALRATMPRTLARLGAHFEPYFAQFLQFAPPATRYLRDLTPRFLEFALPRWAKDSAIPAYASDLARHEALQVELASLLARPATNVAAELAIDESVAFIDAVRLVSYDWAVHRLPDDEASNAVPEPSAVVLLVYRSPEHDVRYLELGRFAAALLEGLLTQQLTLRGALTAAAERVGVLLDDQRLIRTARLLADLAERGALLGNAAAAIGALPETANWVPEAGIPA